MSLSKRNSLTGWAFLAPGAVLILVMSFIPMFRALVMSFQKNNTGEFAGLSNYTRLLQDAVFREAIGNTFFYLLYVPVMLLIALVLAALLNSSNLRCKGMFRTCIFLPCVTSLASYSKVFKALFATDGLINLILVNTHILSESYNFLGHPWSAKFVIVIGMTWRWAGYNMVFYLAGLQNIESVIYEAARIDGANAFQQFWRITIPLLRPTILVTAIMSANGALQLYDESVVLTGGGPGNATITMSHYIYNLAFQYVPNFNYASALAFFIMILVAIAAFIQMKVGDKRD